ncbi:MAG TPA: hypothetical protein VK886_02470 [Vicinamibacterales bacterium]|nr:hypothetical protein [Vicinamibacterales bacterium]
MKRLLFLTLGLLLAFAAVSTAQTTPSPAPGAPTTVGPNFVDANGDGICDRFQSGQAGQMRGQGKRYGNGTGARPQDGTGMGPGPSAGGGTCDGTGPKGRGARRGRG